MEVVIREEAPNDANPIYALNAAAFETDAEARLVMALRAHGRLTLSLVAVQDSMVVGHVAFSPVTVSRPDGSVLAGIGLGPMAVAPSHQGHGIGKRLARIGLERLRAAGHPFCVVLGHPNFYPRFGFKRASGYGIRWERDVPEEVFFALELAPGALEDVSGVVRYSPEFAMV